MRRNTATNGSKRKQERAEEDKEQVEDSGTDEGIARQEEGAATTEGRTIAAGHEHYYIYGGVKYRELTQAGRIGYWDWWFCALCTRELFKRLPPEYDSRIGEQVAFAATPRGDLAVTEVYDA